MAAVRRKRGFENDVDKGWAWVVLAASFMLQFSICGMSYTIGVYNLLFLDVFSSDKATTAWPGAIMNGVYPLVGPLSSAAVRRFGWRMTVMVGGVLFTLGLYTSAWATNIHHLIISYGVISGLGMGIAYTPALTVIGYYFHKRRTMAAGLACMGAAISIIIYPILVNVLNDKFSWRGSLMIMSGLSLHTCVFGMLLRPIDIEEETEPPKIHQSADDFNHTKKRFRHLLSHKGFLLFCMSQFFLCIGISAIYLHLSAYAVQHGASMLESSYLISITGFVSIFSRFMTGMAGNHDTIDNLLLYIGSNGVTGFLTLFCPLLIQTTAGRFTYASILGFYGSCFNSLLAPMTVELVGVYNLNLAFGIEMLADGIGFLVGPPLAGWLYDVTGDYALGFVIAGVSLLLSASIMLFVPLVHHGYRLKRNFVTGEVLDNMVTSI